VSYEAKVNQRRPIPCYHHHLLMGATVKGEADAWRYMLDEERTSLKDWRLHPPIRRFLAVSGNRMGVEDDA
jgi:hypothetical protein